MLLAVHMAIALDVRHGWSHASVVRTVEDQARAVYGVDWGGGAWMNYAFLALWLIECAWWRIAPGPYRARPWCDHGGHSRVLRADARQLRRLSSRRRPAAPPDWC